MYIYIIDRPCVLDLALPRQAKSPMKRTRIRCLRCSWIERSQLSELMRIFHSLSLGIKAFRSMVLASYQLDDTFENRPSRAQQGSRRSTSFAKRMLSYWFCFSYSSQRIFLRPPIATRNSIDCVFPSARACMELSTLLAVQDSGFRTWRFGGIMTLWCLGARSSAWPAGWIRSICRNSSASAVGLTRCLRNDCMTMSIFQVA